VETNLIGLDSTQLFGLAVRLVIAAGLALVTALVTGFILAVVFRTAECAREGPGLFGRESPDEPARPEAPSGTEGELLQPCVE
jgi:hypothetical protein